MAWRRKNMHLPGVGKKSASDAGTAVGLLERLSVYLFGSHGADPYCIVFRTYG